MFAQRRHRISRRIFFLYWSKNMNSIRKLLAGTSLAAGALLTAAAQAFRIASAADDDRADRRAGGPHGWHHHHGPDGICYRKLGLTDAQKAQIKTIMQAAGPQMKSLHQQMRANSLKLRQTQPNDPNYSNVVSEVSQANATLHAQIDTQKAQRAAADLTRC